MRKKHYKITDLEFEFLHIIAEVKSSNSSLALRLGRNDPQNIGKITKKLKDRNMIMVEKQSNNEKKLGRSNQIFFKLTKEGLLYLVKSKITADEFLRILSSIYNNNQNQNTVSNINEIFEEYEKTNMPFSNELTPLLLKNFLPHYPSLPDEYEDHKAVLKSIAYGTPLTEVQLSRRINLKKPTGNILENMLGSMMIAHCGYKERKLCVSHIGILLLLDQMMNMIGTNFDSETNNLTGIASEFFNKLRIDHRDVLPQIFREWDKLKNIQGERILIESIVSFIHKPIIDTLHHKYDNYKRISNVLDLMSISQTNYSRKMVHACIDILWRLLDIQKDKHKIKKISQWIASGNSAVPPSMNSRKIYQKLELIRKCVETIEKQTSFLPFEESKELLEKIGLSINWKVRTSMLEPNIREQITFSFLTMLRQKLEEISYSDNPAFSLLFLPAKKSREDKIKEFNKFLAENKISKQYNKWIDQIIKFESKNIEELKALKIDQ